MQKDQTPSLLTQRRAFSLFAYLLVQRGSNLLIRLTDKVHPSQGARNKKTFEASEKKEADKKVSALVDTGAPCSERDPTPAPSQTSYFRTSTEGLSFTLAQVTNRY